MSAKPLTPFVAHYQAYSAGIPCGKGQLALRQTGSNRFEYHGQGKVCVLGQKVDHRAHYQVEGERWTPLGYTTELKKLFRSRTLAGTPEPTGRYKVTENDQVLPDSDEFPRARREPAMLLKTLGAARASLELDYTWGNETREYHFEYLGEEMLDTPAGRLNTHKFVQDHPNESRVATFWFAESLDGLMVRMESSRLGLHWLTVELADYRALPATLP